MHIIGQALGQFAEIRRIGDQPAEIDIIAVGIDHGQAMFLRQFGDQGAVRDKAAALIDEGGVELLLRHLDKGAAKFRIIDLSEEIPGQRDPHLLCRLAIRRLRSIIPRIREEIGGPGRPGQRFLENLHALGDDGDAGVDADTGQIAAGMRETRDQPAASGSPVIATIGIVEVAAVNALVRSLRLVMMTSGLWPTTSVARAAKRSERPSAE